MAMKLGIGDVVRLRKQHPCGGFEWEITRLGADIGLQCLRCGRRVLLARSKVEKRIKAVVSTAVDATAAGTTGMVAADMGGMADGRGDS